jgi:hypothetical protein
MLATIRLKAVCPFLFQLKVYELKYNIYIYIYVYNFIFSCCCKAWSLILREEHKSRHQDVQNVGAETL